MENLVGYAQRDMVVPLLTEGQLSGRPVDVHASNTAARQWMVEVNAVGHSEICAVPDTQLIREREVLRPLPSLRLEICPPPVTRKVDRGSCVRFASARYLVPTRLIGSTVRLVQAGGRLLIAEATGEVVADHALVAPGAASVLDAHYDGPRPAPSRGPRPKTGTVERFCARGPAAEVFIVGAAAIGNTRLAGDWACSSRSARRTGTQALTDALGRAVAFKRFRAADVRSILVAGTSAQLPSRPVVPLVIDLPVAPTRSLDTYSITAITGSTIPAADHNPDTAPGVST